MSPIVHPEVLARDWVPPTVIDRAREVAETVRRLDAPRPATPPPWIVGIAGPSGSGTSVVARRAAREVLDRLRADRAGPPPRLVAVRTATARGTHGVAAALLRALDDGFDGRGFPAIEILAGFLRRLRRENRPAVIVLDDVQAGGPDLAPVLRALAAPDRFLPEDASGLPSIWTIVAATPEGWAAIAAHAPRGLDLGPPVALGPYSGGTLEAIVRDRWVRAEERPPTDGELEAVLARIREDGGGARRAVDLLRRRAAEDLRHGGETGLPSALRPPAVEVERRVVRAIEEAARHQEAAVGEVRRREAELAEAQGIRPLPATTLWRRIVSLERAGYVARAIRPGGIGGTRSVVRLLTPVEEWVTTSRPSEIRPAAGSWRGAGPAWAAPETRAGGSAPPWRPPVGPAD